MEPASSQPSQRLTPELQAVIGNDWNSVLPTDWYARNLAADAWDRFIGAIYRGPLPASATGVDMSLVIGTVGTIDPTSICDDPACDQRGELMKDHRVTHRVKTKKGTRGTCQHCGGNLHNTNDAAQLIAFQCLWRQVFGKSKVTVNAHTLGVVAAAMDGGTINVTTSARITGWADKTFMASVLAAPKAPPAAAPAGPALTGSVPAAAPTLPASPAAPSPAATSAVPTPAPTTPTTTSSAPIVDPAVTEEKRRKLREALKGARVQP